jgi:hypothetical protein
MSWYIRKKWLEWFPKRRPQITTTTTTATAAPSEQRKAVVVDRQAQRLRRVQLHMSRYFKAFLGSS